MTVASDLCRCGGAPLKIPPILGVQRIFSKNYRKRTPTEIIPNRSTKEPNFAVACLIHVLTQHPRNLQLKTRRGLLISICPMYGKKGAETLRRVKIKITSPLRVFSWRFGERWVSRCMGHTTAKFGSLGHRFGMISVGVLFR